MAARLSEPAAWLGELTDLATAAGRLVSGRDAALAGDDGALGTAGGASAAEVLRLVDAVISAATAIKMTALRAQDTGQEWRSQGFSSLEEWRAATSGQGKAAAYRDARIARDLGELTETDRALGEGRISPEAVATISRWRHSGDTVLRDSALQTGTEARLLRVAERGDHDALARSARMIGHVVDSSALTREHEQVRARRYLRMKRRSGGIAGEFFLDAIAGNELRQALEAHAARPAADDDRTAEQRAADALADLAKTGLDSGTCKNGALVRPHVSVIMREETLAEALARRVEDAARPDELTPSPAKPEPVEAEIRSAPAAADDSNSSATDAGSPGTDADTPASIDTADTIETIDAHECGECRSGPQPLILGLDGDEPRAVAQSPERGELDAESWRARLARERSDRRRMKERDRLTEIANELQYPTVADATCARVLAETGADPLTSELSSSESSTSEPFTSNPHAPDPHAPGRDAGPLALEPAALRARAGILASAKRTAIPAAELEDGTFIPPHVLSAILCDCLIGRIVVDADGQPVDIGREKRTAIADLRRAVQARDRTCRYPTCSMPARWCDYHHFIEWAKGGDTSVGNGLLLCAFHHVSVVHGLGVRIDLVRGGIRFSHRDGTAIGTTYHQTMPDRARLEQLELMVC